MHSQQATGCRRLLVIAVLAMATAAIVANVLSIAQTAQAGPGFVVRYVSAGNGADTGGCTNGAAPCRTIQYAVDQAASGDIVMVARGVYTQTSVRPRRDVTTTGSVTQVVYLTKSVNLVGGFNGTTWANPDPVAYPTTIDAQGRGRGIYVSNAAPLIDGFRITGGTAKGLGGIPPPYGPSGPSIFFVDTGGGIYSFDDDRMLLRNSTLYSNTADYGGGIAYYGGSYQPPSGWTTGNTIISNTAVDEGGGVYLRFSRNVALMGNTIRDNNARGHGGGVYAESSRLTLTANLILSNSASSGGGIYSESANALLARNLVRYNQASWVGGGIALWGNTQVVNNIIADNQASKVASGLFVGASAELSHNTFARNSGGDGSALVVGPGWTAASAVLTNTVFVSHTLAISVSTGSTVTVRGGTLMQPMALAGAGTLNWEDTTWTGSGDPRFAPDGYHLLADSPAIETGLETGVKNDIDGDARPSGLFPDLGADEFLFSTRYVATSGADTSNACGQATRPCRTVQRAVDMADAGNTVLVASGVYSGVQARARRDPDFTGSVTQVVYITKSVALYGGYTTTNLFASADPAANATTLDARSQGRGVYIAGYISVTLNGFTIVNGNALNQGGWPGYGRSNSVGGGVYAISATVGIAGNTIQNSEAGNAGTASTWGGGLFAARAKGSISGNQITGNAARGDGAGVALYQGSVTFAENRVTGNSARVGTGGLAVYYGADTLSHNFILSNTGTTAGGLYGYHTDLGTFDGNLIAGNTSTSPGSVGAGVTLVGGGRFVNNAIVDNRSGGGSGSGVYMDGGTAQFIHTTVARNTGGDGSAIFISGGSAVQMTNTIVANQSVGISVTAGSTLTFDSILFFGNTDNIRGSGGVVANRLYVGDPAFASDGYHLTVGSAAIDKGVNAGIASDIDGEVRPLGAAPDLGADEFKAIVKVLLPLIRR